jgi:hypothetical protein
VVYTFAMPECPVCEAIEKLRKEGRVPIGIIVYEMKAERLALLLLPDVQDMKEANALLSQIGVRMES